MRKAVIISQNGMGSGDTELGLLLLRRYLRHDLEKDDRAERYVFYNGGRPPCSMTKSTDRHRHHPEPSAPAVPVTRGGALRQGTATRNRGSQDTGDQPACG